MTVYNDLNELVEDYIKNSLLTEDEIVRIRESDMVIEDMIPSGGYRESVDGTIIVY